MKKTGALLIGIINVLLLLGACGSSDPAKFDENLPLEESSRLFFFPSLEVTAYNGIPIPGRRGIDNVYRSSWRYIALPPGDIVFTVNTWSSTYIPGGIGTGVRVSGINDLVFSYTFEAGGLDYLLGFTKTGGPDKNQLGVNIFRENFSDMDWSKELIPVAFRPFEN